MSAAPDKHAPGIESLPRLSHADFGRFSALIHELAGVQFRPEKLPLLAAKLGRRLRALGLDSYTLYYDRVRTSAEERQRMLEAIVTGETRLFREPGHFEFVTHTLIPRWRDAAAHGLRPRTVRAWSAGCSTGEEPHSIAIALLAGLGSGWTVQVIASDLSRIALETARAGIWDVDRVKDVPIALRRYVLRGVGSQTGRMKATAEVSQVISFLQLNLHDASYPFTTPFDLIFCRNVLIYFGTDAKVGVLRRMSRHLAADGHLFLGHAESITGLVTGLRCVRPTIHMLSTGGDAE
ncbi:MAG TPA: CheR family methyltransferase [Kofleriaceae bacterium]|nr:CheR family methyltransferase [Kofleriaceae bacterium]